MLSELKWHKIETKETINVSDIIKFNRYGNFQIYTILTYWSCHFFIFVYKICIIVKDQIIKIIEAKKKV